MDSELGGIVVFGVLLVIALIGLMKSSATASRLDPFSHRDMTRRYDETMQAADSGVLQRR